MLYIIDGSGPYLHDAYKKQMAKSFCYRMYGEFGGKGLSLRLRVDQHIVGQGLADQSDREE